MEENTSPAAFKYRKEIAASREEYTAENLWWKKLSEEGLEEYD